MQMILLKKYPAINLKQNFHQSYAGRLSISLYYGM